ncbi:MAG: mandelate racemase/muconate lactonizing enzyme family protein [candidate division KSB1 bacterium]|nr:mandelate racemase/muconate lactonizing enzyme family protein [candidate division KSB1 bacterium]
MNNQLNRRNFLSALGLTAAGTFAMATPLAAIKPQDDKFNPLPKVSDLKITDVKTYKLARAILIKLETNTDINGWGEASSNSRPVIEAFIHDKLKKVVIGQDPFNVEPLWDRLFWGEHDLGPAGALPYAIAGLDLAMWDIKGKVLNVPVYRLLGGCYRKEMPAYCGIPLNGGKVSVEEAIERAQKVVALGFKVIKLRMQIREYNLDPIPDPTIPYYTALRKALPDEVEIFVDPNEGYTAARAIQVGKELQNMGMKYYESPCPLEDHRDLAEVVRAMDIPVMAGEKCYTRWQMRDLILEANPDIIQPDVIKAGGITEVKKIAALGQTFFKALVLHNTKPTLGTAASLHVMASISNAGPFLEFVELDSYREVLSVFDTQIAFKDGKLLLPELPGLGLVINEKRVEKLAK